MKITGQIEQIFAHAVALDQSGGLKNTIYVKNKEIYIVNYDHTVILRFKLRDSENPFSTSLSFKANDYDSNEFFEEDGKIVFISNIEGYERKKVCGLAEHSPEEIKKIIRLYLRNSENREKLIIHKSILSLLDNDLSHIEFSGKKGESLKMIQRNIYSGGIIEVKEKNQGMFFNTLKNDFGPVGIKTKDFAALFTFQDSLIFEFPNTSSEDYMIIKSVDQKKRDMTGIIACCLYDELITLKKARNGREK
jgi:hypothetical protein